MAFAQLKFHTRGILTIEQTKKLRRSSYLAGVNSNNAKEEVSAHAQGERYRWIHNGLHRARNVRLENLHLRTAITLKRQTIEISN